MGREEPESGIVVVLLDAAITILPTQYLGKTQNPEPRIQNTEYRGQHRRARGDRTDAGEGRGT